ncbi:hypothetical protein ACTP13_21900 [Paenibacillus peoriae]|uniref:hypothetical protein n=1 Tax=Paenibacillus peoriae TaxID=59893 RepID=UPI003F95ED8C
MGLVIRMILVVIIIVVILLAILFGKGIRNLFSLAFIGIFTIFLWEIAWWGKVIDLILALIFFVPIINGLIQGFRTPKVVDPSKPSGTRHVVKSVEVKPREKAQTSFLSDFNLIEIAKPYGDIDLSKVNVTMVSSTLMKRVPYFRKIQLENREYIPARKVTSSNESGISLTKQS